MKFSEDNLSDGYHITGYENDRVLVNGKAFKTSLVISPELFLADWPPITIEELTPAHIKAIVQMQPELVLLGTGQTLKFPEVATYAALIQLGIGVEVMDTGAACRTYNILTGEGRKAVAGLII